MRNDRYRTTRDIVVPAGTILMPPPVHSSRWTSHHDAPVALDRGHCAYISMSLEDAFALGIVEKIDAA